MPGHMLVWLVDGVLLVAVLEGFWLLRRARRAGLPRLPLAANLGAGLALIGALRGALGDAPAGWVVVCLMIAGLAHAVDLRARWRPAPQRPAAAPARVATADASDDACDDLPDGALASRRPPAAARPTLLQPLSHR